MEIRLGWAISLRERNSCLLNLKDGFRIVAVERPESDGLLAFGIEGLKDNTHAAAAQLAPQFEAPISREGHACSVPRLRSPAWGVS